MLTFPNVVNGNSGNSRSSFVGGYYQNGRASGYRSDSVFDDYEGRPADPQYSLPPRASRHGSIAKLASSNSENFYHSHGHQPSYDTIATSRGSYATDGRGTSSDPSSQNSSVDRFPTKPEDLPADNSQSIGYVNGPYSSVAPAYNGEQAFWRGASGRPQAPYGKREYVNNGNGNGNGHGHGNGFANGSANGNSLALNQSTASPPPPPKHSSPLTAPIKLNTGTVIKSEAAPAKRQSWLKRRFSKKSSAS
jgi:hypothetical protein